MTDKIIERLEELKTIQNYSAKRQIIQDCIDIVKQISEEGGWIKCSDRMPNTNGEYLVTYKWLNCYYTKHINFENLKTKGKWKSKENIIAWKEKEKPYKEAHNK